MCAGIDATAPSGLQDTKEWGCDAAMNRWLRDEVVPVMEDARAHPEQLLTPEQVRRSLKLSEEE